MKMFRLYHRCLAFSAGPLCLLTKRNISFTSAAAFVSRNNGGSCHNQHLCNARKSYRRNYCNTAITMSRYHHYPTIDEKILVSVDDCLDAYNTQVISTSNSDVDSSSPAADTSDNNVPITPTIVFVDGSWYHRSKRSGRDDFENGPRIVGAQYADMDDICAKGTTQNPKNLPHMMPTKELFAATMDAMGISNDDYVIIYGRDGCVFTPRTWFLFQQMGHDQDKVKLMQGSLEEWIDKGGPIETNPTTIVRTDDLNVGSSATKTLYKARDAPNIVTMEDMLEAVTTNKCNELTTRNNKKDHDSAIILDPRGTTFDAGHIPSAINVPYLSIVTDDDLLKFKPSVQLQEIFDKAGVNVHTDENILLSCGTGVSVCHLYLALQECGRDNTDKTFVYDGSWAEWGAEESTPKESSISPKET